MKDSQFGTIHGGKINTYAGSLVAAWAHNPRCVGGALPPPATKDFVL